MVPMRLEEVIERLKGVVKPEFKWPEIPAGWQLEFIAFSNSDVAMDLLHPVSGTFWSDDHGHFEPPVMLNGEDITANALKAAGVPFMTPCHAVVVIAKPKQPHLTAVIVQ
jgi:hypothetical protein